MKKEDLLRLLRCQAAGRGGVYRGLGSGPQQPNLAVDISTTAFTEGVVSINRTLWGLTEHVQPIGKLSSAMRDHDRAPNMCQSSEGTPLPLVGALRMTVVKTATELSCFDETTYPVTVECSEQSGIVDVKYSRDVETTAPISPTHVGSGWRGRAPKWRRSIIKPQSLTRTSRLVTLIAR